MQICLQQDKPRLTINNVSYTCQSLMGPKNSQTKHITLQHIQNSGLNELNRNYGIIYKIGQNLGYKAG